IKVQISDEFTDFPFIRQKQLSLIWKRLLTISRKLAFGNHKEAHKVDFMAKIILYLELWIAAQWANGCNP
ncbi:MAG: hypothetical protein ACE5EK_10735, partial [Nitrospinales bacterium]